MGSSLCSSFGYLSVLVLLLGTLFWTLGTLFFGVTPKKLYFFLFIVYFACPCFLHLVALLYIATLILHIREHVLIILRPWHNSVFGITSHKTLVIFQNTHTLSTLYPLIIKSLIDLVYDGGRTLAGILHRWMTCPVAQSLQHTEALLSKPKDQSASTHPQATNHESSSH